MSFRLTAAAPADFIQLAEIAFRGVAIFRDLACGRPCRESVCVCVCLSRGNPGVASGSHE